jgi:predicted anti-sigma-YlaC factor YlaD
MNCKIAQSQLALLVGNDLEPAAVDQVRKHLDKCDCCRRHFDRLTAAQEALQAPAEGAWSATDESLWPKLSVRLASATAGSKPHRLNGWAASLAVAAACTAMVWVASHQWTGPPAPEDVGQPVRGISDQAPAPAAPDNGDVDSIQRRSDDDAGIMRLRSRSAPATRVVPINQGH